MVQSPVGVEIQRILRHRLPERGDRFLTAPEMLQNIALVVSKVRKARREDLRAFEVHEGAGKIALRTTRPAQVSCDSRPLARCLHTSSRHGKHSLGLLGQPGSHKDRPRASCASTRSGA